MRRRAAGRRRWPMSGDLASQPISGVYRDSPETFGLSERWGGGRPKGLWPRPSVSHGAAHSPWKTEHIKSLEGRLRAAPDRAAHDAAEAALEAGRREAAAAASGFDPHAARAPGGGAALDKEWQEGRVVKTVWGAPDEGYSRLKSKTLVSDPGWDTARRLEARQRRLRKAADARHARKISDDHPVALKPWKQAREDWDGSVRVAACAGRVDRTVGAAGLYEEFDKKVGLPGGIQQATDEIKLDIKELRRLATLASRNKLRGTLKALANWEELGQLDPAKMQMAVLEPEVKRLAAAASLNSDPLCHEQQQLIQLYAVVLAQFGTRDGTAGRKKPAKPRARAAGGAAVRVQRPPSRLTPKDELADRLDLKRAKTLTDRARPLLMLLGVAQAKCASPVWLWPFDSSFVLVLAALKS